MGNRYKTKHESSELLNILNRTSSFIRVDLLVHKITFRVKAQNMKSICDLCSSGRKASCVKIEILSVAQTLCFLEVQTV
jgi:hypothetical protein